MRYVDVALQAILNGQKAITNRIAEIEKQQTTMNDKIALMDGSLSTSNNKLPSIKAILSFILVCCFSISALMDGSVAHAYATTLWTNAIDLITISQ